MASPSVPEEVFRFSIVRNPQPAPREAQDRAIAIIPPGGEDSHPYFNALAGLRRNGSPRTDIVGRASQIVADPKYLAQLDGLQTAVLEFADRLALLRAASGDGVRALVEDVLGAFTSDDLAADRAVIADSLIAASVVEPPTAGLRGRLMRALRAFDLLALMAEQRDPDAHEIEAAQTATLLLPSALFPLPADDRRAKANKAAYERRRAQLDEERTRAQGVLDEIAQNDAAVEELAEALSTHLFQTRRKGDGPAAVSSGVDVLPTSRVHALSAATRKVILGDFEIEEDSVEVPFVVEKLEKRNVRLGRDLVTSFGDLILEADPLSLPSCGECTPVVLPEPKSENDFTPDTRGAVEVVGVQDLLIVRQRLREYRAGEIAHIENVLRGERKAKTHRKLDRSETTIFEESEREQEIEEELQTTEKYELQTESSRVIQEDRAGEAGVTVTASYGSVDIEAHGSYSSATSVNESRSASSTYARDVLSRSVQRVRERVLSRRSRVDISELEIINEHEFDNRRGDDHVTGIYRWVDKFYEAQIVNYGKRTMLEFMIPDPAAFTRFAATNRPASPASVPKPEVPGFCRDGVFHPLTPADLRPDNYLCFVSKYRVSDVAPPIPRYIRVPDVVKFKVASTDGEPITFAEVNDGFAVPNGYAPRSVDYTISGGNSHSATTSNDDHDDIIMAIITIGGRRVFRFYKSEIGEVGGEDFWEDLTQTIEWDGGALSPREQQFGGYVVGAPSGSFALAPTGTAAGDADTVEVSLVGHTTLPMSVSIQYTVLCERTQAKFEQWQMDTFTAIQAAYLAMKQEYDASLEAQQAVGLVSIEGRNPLINREVEKRELKKFAISLLTGQQFESFNAMEVDHVTGIPQIDLADAAAEGSFVRFFEQALEWKHITYLFYPYFWADKAGWTRAVHQRDTDPLFEQFLQAGYARAWVPVRPGFELLITSYIQAGGEPWTEKDAPLVEEPAVAPPFLSLIEEMKEQLSADFETRAGTVRVRRDDPVVRGTGTDLRDDDVDREILLDLNYYRIAAVDVAAQTLTLREPYAGDDHDATGFGIGVKFVGEPWLVQVPTTLVHLKGGADLVHR